MGRVITAIAAVFVAWTAIDFVVHGVILWPAYLDTQQFWRADEEMKTGLMSIVTLTCSVVFVLIYHLWIRPKSLTVGIKYGVFYGVAWGMSFGYGMYSVMPIPYMLALVWFWGTVIEATLAGALVGALLTEEAPTPIPGD